MIKVILFDFDGVVVDSVNIKTEAFKELFRKEKQKHLSAVLRYHEMHGGISRINKIIHFYENIFRRPLSQKELTALANKFSRIVKDKVIESPFIQGAQIFFKRNYQKYSFYVISGAPQEELKEIMAKRNLLPYFIQVFGSPPGKVELINSIIIANGYSREEVLFVGDSADDAGSAFNCDIQFIRLCDIKYLNSFRDDDKFSSITGYKELERFLDGVKI